MSQDTLKKPRKGKVTQLKTISKQWFIIVVSVIKIQHNKRLYHLIPGLKRLTRHCIIIHICKITNTCTTTYLQFQK